MVNLEFTRIFCKTKTKRILVLYKLEYIIFRVLSGFSQDTVRIQSGYSQDTIRIQSGYGQDTIRIQSVHSQDTVRIKVRIQLGYSLDTVRIQSGYSQDIVRIQSGYSIVQNKQQQPNCYTKIILRLRGKNYTTCDTDRIEI